jgi:hypothetical protein
MRSALIPIACLLAVVATAQPAAAATRKERQRICAKRGVTVASSRWARVFVVDRGGNQSMYGCMRAGGRLQLLSRWFSCGCSVGDDPDPDAQLHAGRFVELTEYASCGPDPEPRCGGSSVSLRDLRTRREASAQDAVGQVVAGSGGAFAFYDGRVVVVDGGGQRVLDEGPGVEDGSLAFARTQLYWTRDGQPFSAPLQ